MSDIINLSRRSFIVKSGILGGGLLLGMYLPGKSVQQVLATESSEVFVPNAFMRIGVDESITMFVNKAEMGQGVYTSLPMLIAEELEADWQRIKVEAAPIEPDFNHTMYGPIMVTGGSTSIRSEWERLRKMGASARIMLIQAAAETWGVDPTGCMAKDGFVLYKETEKKISYGALVGKAVTLQPPEEVVLKKASEFNIIGKDRKRFDIPDKTDGKAIFGIDAKVEGMLVALIARPPLFGATVKSYDDAETKKIKGVKHVVQIDRGVAIVADGFWSASQGRDVLKIEWDEGPLAGLDSKQQTEEYAAMAAKPGLVAATQGDFAGAIASSVAKLEAVYEFPYLAHAPMEPLNCLADVREDGCDIWTGSQMQTPDRNKAAALTGLPPEKVKLHNTLLGGGFGRRAVPDSHFVAEAIQVSMKVKAPVKVYWTREDDIQGGYYRPKAYNLLTAGIGEDGMPVALKHTVVSQSIAAGTPFEEALIHDGIDHTSVEGSADSPYQIPNMLVEYHMAPAGVPVLWWRAVGHTYNGYVKECFIDELAKLAGKDPYEYRRRLLSKSLRERQVLEIAAEKSKWSEPVTKGRGRGIAVHASFGSYVAQVAEVSLNDNGTVRVHKVTCVVDCGQTVNPDTIIAQMESGIAFGLSAVFYGEIVFKNGRIQQSNFDDYDVLRINEMPKVDVHIVESNEPPGGIGEVAVPPIAPAVANAVAAITGKHIRSLPLRPEKLKEAMQQATA